MRYFNDYIRSPAQTQDSIRKSLNRVDITKKDEEKQYVFGWAKIAVDENGNQLVDRQNDLIDPEELEQDRKSTRLNSSHIEESRMPSSA